MSEFCEFVVVMETLPSGTLISSSTSSRNVSAFSFSKT